MKLIVLLSTFNGESFLLDQIDSIAKQSFHDWKILLRDDGSSDLTKQILKKTSNEYPAKIEISEDSLGNIGPLSSFSTLAKNSDTDYLLFCDQDDVWFPDKIEKTLETMRAAECRFGADTPLLVHSDLSVVDSSLQPLSPSFWKYQHINPELGMSLNRVMPQNVVTGCTVMINRALAKFAMPIPEEAIMHDWWLALVAALFGHIIYLDEPTVLYRQHGGNSLGAKRWGVRRIFKQAQSPQEVRASMLRTMRQAQALLSRYRDRMSPGQLAMVEAYATLPAKTKAARIKAMLKYRFFKHGIIRNIGFMANLLMIERSD